MEMPLLLPAQLNYCRQVDAEETLLKWLLKSPPDLILFLESACDHESWAEKHEAFMHGAIEWVQQQFFQDQLLMDLAYRLVKALRQHPRLAQDHLVNNVTLQLQEGTQPINSLMYGASSYYLKDLIRLECRDRGATSISMPLLSKEVLTPLHEYIMLGTSASLSTQDQPTGEAIVALAQRWELKELMKMAEEALKKWIEADNVIEILLKSHREGWKTLRFHCYEYINALPWDFSLLEPESEGMMGEFLRFSDESWRLFSKLKGVLSGLAFSGSLFEESGFVRALQECPHLRKVSLSFSKQFSRQLQEMPPHLEELILHACPWVNESTLNTLTHTVGAIHTLDLASNPQLNYRCWGTLKGFRHLHHLSVARCLEVGDQDLKLILEYGESLTSLDLEECRFITDRGFSQIPLFNTQLSSLNLARTSISDWPLIELGTLLPQLTYLDLTRCEKLSDKGILELIRVSKKLKELRCQNPRFSDTLQQEVQKINPFLKLYL